MLPRPWFVFGFHPKKCLSDLRHLRYLRHLRCLRSKGNHTPSAGILRSSVVVNRQALDNSLWCPCGFRGKKLNLAVQKISPAMFCGARGRIQIRTSRVSPIWTTTMTMVTNRTVDPLSSWGRFAGSGKIAMAPRKGACDEALARFELATYPFEGAALSRLSYRASYEPRGRESNPQAPFRETAGHKSAEPADAQPRGFCLRYPYIVPYYKGIQRCAYLPNSGKRPLACLEV